MRGADVVVVGGGAAGCVLAARLSADPDRSVLLLEEGPAPTALGAYPSRLLDATRIPGADPGDPFDRWYPSELLPGRPWDVVRGRVLGGSTAVNGGYFVRPRASDLRRWSAHGDEAWSWSSALPLLRDLERDLDLGDGPLHGGSGPVPVHRPPLEHPAAAAFAESALAAGHPPEPDKNGEQPPGIGPMPSDAVGGVRWNAALTHLLPVLRRPNLRVAGGARVLRVELRGGRAVGVRVRIDDRELLVGADAVVLAAGALASPTLLMRSGIGPADDLLAAGVRPVVDAPGVGAAFSDHPQVVLAWTPDRTLRPPADGWAGAMLTCGGADGDAEVLQSLRPLGTAAGPALPVLVSSHTAVPAGRLRLRPSGSDGRTEIGFHYLGSADDRRRLRGAVLAAGEVLEGAPMRAVGRAERIPSATRELDDWIADRIGTALHTCGTVPFRAPDGSPGPVDQFGAVRGVAGLHVADTSILPDAPSRGPAVAAALVGEVVATAMAPVR